jgi:hypothetical protein
MPDFRIGAYGAYDTLRQRGQGKPNGMGDGFLAHWRFSNSAMVSLTIK